LPKKVMFNIRIDPLLREAIKTTARKRANQINRDVTASDIALSCFLSDGDVVAEYGRLKRAQKKEITDGLSGRNQRRNR
jgi:hypothetical protein